MKAGRLPWPTPEQLTPEQRTLYDAIVGGRRADGEQAFPLTDTAGRLHGPFNAMLFSPQIGTAVQALGSAIRFQSSLSDREREIAILELAVLRQSEFEWYAHVRVGHICGLNDAEIQGLKRGDEIASLTPNEALVRTLVRLFVIVRDLDSSMYARAEAELGIRRLTDIIVLVGYYDLLATSLRVCRTPLPAETALAFD